LEKNWENRRGGGFFFSHNVYSLSLQYYVLLTEEVTIIIWSAGLFLLLLIAFCNINYATFSKLISNPNASQRTLNKRCVLLDSKLRLHSVQIYVQNRNAEASMNTFVNCKLCNDHRTETMNAQHQIKISKPADTDCTVEFLTGKHWPLLHIQYINVLGNSSFNAHSCHIVTAIKHPVPDQVKPSFAIFDIWALRPK